MNDPFKMPNPFGSANTSSSNNNNNKTPQKKNFIESFREQGSAATSGMVGNAAEQLFGASQSRVSESPNNPNVPNTPNQPPFNFAEFLKRREQKLRQQERGMADQQRRQERIIFHKKEENAKKEIEIIKQELMQIIKTTNGISADILAAEQSVMTNTVEVGTYQLNFFQRIKKLLIIARRNLSESAHWLEEFNARKKAKGYYWGQVKKSGSKFMLSQERYMITQTG